ncbi:signal peptidase I [Nesterenkonia ebinurensis]|uniref:signal peptidase I n=1 Tax=Nesterenkonia ebinurensis TaxID=2608252 RepID=UPI00168C0936|nr:signal peptidase I [Nesterenkonia ebinurensis]
MSVHSGLRLLRTLAVALLGALLLLPLAIVPLDHRLVVVDGASMAPTYQVGDVILVGPADQDFEVGAVVTARGVGGLYTHRIVDVTEEDGQPVATTRGDANAYDDAAPLHPENVEGTVRFHTSQPWAGLIGITQSMPGRITLAALIAIVLLLPIRDREATTATLRNR